MFLSTGENLDSLGKSKDRMQFWCFSGKEEKGQAYLKAILYRRPLENKIMVLGGKHLRRPRILCRLMVTMYIICPE